MNIEAIAVFYIVLLISLVVHEASHALFALLGGDRTAYLGGQVTLNPIPHIQREPFGTVVIPLAMLFISNGTMTFGYAHAPVDPVWAHRHPKRAALMAAAGPLSNVLLVVLAVAALKMLVGMGYADSWPAGPLWVDPIEPSGATYAVARIASAFALINIILAVLNFFPWPPFDGSAVVAGLVPNPMERFYAFVRSQFFLVLLGVVVVWNTLEAVVAPIRQWVLSII